MHPHSSHRPLVAIITPYLADANNGNWRTARRWQQLLSARYNVILATKVEDARSERNRAPELVIVLHARRGHDAVLRARALYPMVPVVVVLTGTDLYKDLPTSPEAQESIAIADALVVLQADALAHLPMGARRKTHVIYQSAKPLAPAIKTREGLNCVVVGHLRAEKSPETIFAAVDQLKATEKIHVTHIGNAMDESLAQKALAQTASQPHYRWVGGLSHGLTRAAIKRAHLLIHPSILEGGANVIAEALVCGTPVVASQMSGNVGMLGDAHPGFFPVGDVGALVALLRRCKEDQRFYSRLASACAQRAAVFHPDQELRSLEQLIQSMRKPDG